MANFARVSLHLGKQSHQMEPSNLVQLDEETKQRVFNSTLAVDGNMQHQGFFGLGADGNPNVVVGDYFAQTHPPFGQSLEQMA